MKNLIIKYKKLIQFILINCLFLFMILLSNMQSIKYIYIPIVIMYLIYICLLDDFDCVYNQIVLLCALTLFYDNLWRWKPSLNVPLSLKYVVDIISIILLFKIIIHGKRYYNILKDKIMIIILLFIVISIIGYLGRDISFINYIMSMRIYLRFLPVYIILSNSEKIFIKEDLKTLILLNLIPLPIFKIKSHQDDFSGVFGISSVQVFFLLILMIYIAVIILALNKKIKVVYLIISIITTFVLCGLGEIKIAFALIPIISVVIILINKKNIVSIIKILIPMGIMLIIGVNILIKVNPEFIEFFDRDKIEQNIVNYTMKTNNEKIELGRLENIIYTNNSILTDSSKKLYGLGIGSCMPNENWYYEAHADGRTVISLYETDMYKQYGYLFGYHFSSMNIIYLENGIVGLLIFYIIIIIIIIRAIRLIKQSNNITDKCIGNVTIAFILAWIPLMYYYAYLLDRSPVYMFIIVSALTTNRYNNIKIKSTN